MIIPNIFWKIKAMFQTTNQSWRIASQTFTPAPKKKTTPTRNDTKQMAQKTSNQRLWVSSSSTSFIHHHHHPPPPRHHRR
jgi:hypothetical protein